MWTVGYTKEVRNYIYDSYPYTEEVWKVIKSLRHTTDGLPDQNWKMIEPELYLWTVAEHFVIYTRIVDERKLIVTALKPVDD